jgi:3-oxoacyl-[acyl-carrier protein] reductase
MSILNDKIALVTGASRGIGRACAISLAKRGAFVVVGYNKSESGAQETLQEITKADGRGEILHLDVSADEETIKAAVRSIVDRHGRIDILVNNAGTTEGESLLASMQVEAMEHQFKTNFWGAVLCTKAVVPYMMQKRSGRIITIGSIVAATGNIGQTIYSASKAALEGFTRSLEIGRAHV